MAQSMKRTNNSETNIDKSVDIEEKPTKKKFNNDDMIQCRSITNGKLVFEGKRSGNTYRWMNYGDVEYVEYRDLFAALNDTNGRSILFMPRIIVDDKDFVDQNSKLKDFYDNMYTVDDFEEILSLPISQMKNIVEDMPEGAKACLKGLVATAISNGKLDSVKKIKALDEIFGTEMFGILTD